MAGRSQVVLVAEPAAVFAAAAAAVSLNPVECLPPLLTSTLHRDSVCTAAGIATAASLASAMLLLRLLLHMLAFLPFLLLLRQDIRSRCCFSA